jgi:hypothetical protein
MICEKNPGGAQTYRGERRCCANEAKATQCARPAIGCVQTDFHSAAIVEEAVS